MTHQDNQPTAITEPDQISANQPGQPIIIGPDTNTEPITSDLSVNIGPTEPIEPPTTPLSTPPFAATTASAEPVRPYLTNPLPPPVAQGAAPPTYGPPLKTGPRAGIIVWGLLVVLTGLLCFSLSAGHAIDFGLIVIGCLVVAGLALLFGSLIGVARSRSRSGDQARP